MQMPGWMKQKLKSRLLEKYQQPQICRWYHPYGQKLRQTSESLDESERGEWKSWLKAQHSENEDHGIWSHCFMANRWENMERVTDFIFLGTKITADGDCSHNIKTLAPWTKSYNKPRQCIKKQRHHPANKGLNSQSYCFSSSHEQMWELYHKEGWVLKNWWTVVFEKRVPWTARRSNRSVL